MVVVCSAVLSGRGVSRMMTFFPQDPHSGISLKLPFLW